jgi:hypothetical protein
MKLRAVKQEKLNTLLLLVTAAAGFFGCNSIDPRYVSKKSESSSAKNTLSSTQPEIDNIGMPTSAVITQSDCHTAGKIWIPISDETGTAACGEEMAPFTCDKATLLATFYTSPTETTLKNTLIDEIDYYQSLGYPMSDCGKVSSTHYRIHWYLKAEDGNENYEITDIKIGA